MTQPQSTPQEACTDAPNVTRVPRDGSVRVARVDRKVLFWTAIVAVVVVSLSFVSIVLHGIILKSGW